MHCDMGIIILKVNKNLGNLKGNIGIAYKAKETRLGHRHVMLYQSNLVGTSIY